MNALRASSLLLALLALIAGGCTTQPPAKAQADFDVEFTLTTSMDTGKMVFLGVGGEIDGVINPDLAARQGDKVRVILVNGDGMPHDFAIPDLNAQTAMVIIKGQTTDVVFETGNAGEFAYYCTVSGHRQAGMEGKLIVSKSQEKP
jgi:nitrite reductase (NO-forming)